MGFYNLNVCSIVYYGYPEHKLFGFVSQCLINLIFEKDDKDNLAVDIFYWHWFEKTKFSKFSFQGICLVYFSYLIFRFEINITATTAVFYSILKATFRLQPFLSVTYNVLGLSNRLTHQKKLATFHKKVAETELRYT